MVRRERSIDADWFEDLYREHGDPWDFETSGYEQAKYAHTLDAMPGERLGDVLEVGCANGVLTERLAPRCERLLAVDVSETALAAARKRLGVHAHVRVERCSLPAEAPDGPFDLVLMSEVLYYWDGDDVARFARWVPGAIPQDGHMLLVHWTGDTDYPKSGDEAVDELRGLLGDRFLVARQERRERYRLDLWRRA